MLVYTIIPKSFLQLNTIFISILIEALPFVILGVFIAGIIQMFVSEEMVAKAIPKNPILAIGYAILIGSLFPACECGIVPIVRRLLLKGVPIYVAIPFMLTGPIINPVVLFSTFVAFGNDWSMVIYRGSLAIIVSVIVGFIVLMLFKGSQLKQESYELHTHRTIGIKAKIKETFDHAIEEFFSVGKYLILGALVAAAVQTYVKTSTLLDIGDGAISSTLVMMGLSFVLSLCSEADAFIASSFRSTFSTGSLTAFLVFGAMVDIKNLFMMLWTFKTKFVMILVLTIACLVFLGALFI
jgi:uncharacterized protein